MRVQEASTSTMHKVANGGRRFDHAPAQQAADSRGETLQQLLDRNLAELLQELRVAFTGVQILFAFLLSMAFTPRFTELNGFDIGVYVVALLSTALATMVLIAPVSFHRIVFRRRQKAAFVVVLGRWQPTLGCSGDRAVGTAVPVCTSGWPSAVPSWLRPRRRRSRAPGRGSRSISPKSEAVR